MSIIAKLRDDMQAAEVDSENLSSSSMSERQREFAKAYVLNGGNATKAAAVAGYSDTDLAKAGMRASLSPKVQAEVRRLAVQNGSMLLPILINRAFEIATDPTIPPREALTAVFGLADRLGMAPPKAGVQVNIGSQVNNGTHSSLIQQIWDARQQRMSVIDGGMTDKPPAIEHARQANLDELYPTAFGRPSWHDEAEGRGGVASPGSPGSGHHIPPPPANPHTFPPQSGQYDPQAEGEDDGTGHQPPDRQARAIEADAEPVHPNDPASAWRVAMRGFDDGAGRSVDTGGQRRPALDYD